MDEFASEKSLESDEIYLVAISSFSVNIIPGPVNGSCFISHSNNNNNSSGSNSYNLSECSTDTSQCRVIRDIKTEDIGSINSYDIYCVSFSDLNGNFPLSYQFLLFSDVDENTITQATQSNSRLLLDGGADGVTGTIADNIDQATATIIQSLSGASQAKLFLTNSGNYVIRAAITNSFGSYSFYDTAVCACDMIFTVCGFFF